ncbi:5-oxoprolinase subunit PxpB [Wenyingzhuangia sp. IMCC45533]
MFDIIPYGEEALLIKFKQEISLKIHLQVKSYYQHLKKMNLRGVTDFIPAYNSLTVCFDSNETNYQQLKHFILQEKITILTTDAQTRNIVKVPVCYDASFGLDLEFVSQKTGLSIQQIISKHTSETYLVYMLGFAPGFMYLGGLNPNLHISRKETPRLKVTAGSVGLADQQTGIYPLETPGGWQIIGRTPLNLFSRDKPSLVEMGDYVQFVPIDKATFYKIQQL